MTTNTSNEKSMKAKILVVDDEESLRYLFETYLLQGGYEASTASDYNEALDKLYKTDFDLIVTDIVLGSKTGIDILRESKKRNPACPVVLITGYPNVETASDAVRQGAYDYIPKPVKNEILIHTVQKALEHKKLVDENVKYQLNLEAIFRSVRDGIVTVDKELKVLEINRASQDICGFPSIKEVRGKKYESLIKGCSEKCFEAIAETFKTKLPVERFCFECNNQYGSRRVIDLTTYPLLDQQESFNGCVMVMKDETRLDDLESNLRDRQQFHNIIGKSDMLLKIYNFVETLANIQTTVLITGENGTGKELLARALHYHGNGITKPFVVVDCAGLSDSLLESELFGHVKGAFTGAIYDRVGRFQKADGGTVFLDEIGDISIKMQLSLLRVLEEMEIMRVGDSTPIKINVRVIAATNQVLHKKIKDGKFRKDLYYRLKVVELTIPPLRDRSEDIPLLVDHFIKKLNEKINKNIKSVSDNVQKLFMDYKWPGNVRELLHTLEFAVIYCNGPVITVGDLPPEFKDRNKGIVYSSGEKENGERCAIVHTLKETGWNKAKAARMLGISRMNIYFKIKKYNITEDRID